ncbi:hypothetical protein [Methylobacterium nodulans]|uniref:Uncharacterized protein n=1 Tax=Methylobacterium nodulans (strain LMG 21967 / CNCM I-2342 / ORS 2060) TaxID=460265 RepID=B8IY51_METNO|nr:hypothetical protein [Methylobacterium nodulans]ACL63341.1 conserved hypothetical protein [Methylobacterium nodulans ORS 2060]
MTLTPPSHGGSSANTAGWPINEERNARAMAFHQTGKLTTPGAAHPPSTASRNAPAEQPFAVTVTAGLQPGGRGEAAAAARPVVHDAGRTPAERSFAELVTADLQKQERSAGAARLITGEAVRVSAEQSFADVVTADLRSAPRPGRA